MNNYNKYIKYKKKYNKLKNGGSNNNNSKLIIDNGDIDNFLQPLIYPKIEKLLFIKNEKTLSILNIILDIDNSKPVLIVVAGISHNSFISTTKIILTKLYELQLKFKNIYIIDCDSYKSNQIEACGIRDKHYKNKNLDKIYGPEENMNNEIAININIIVNKLKLNNVHLLGKCNGAWITTLLLLKNLDIYKALYLAVPAIPFDIYSYINLIENEYLINIKFIFAWNRQDVFPFHWNVVSYKEKERYDVNINQIESESNIKLNYQSFIYDNNLLEDPKKYHEIPFEMITEIIK
jgi:hypothetical protein